MTIPRIPSLQPRPWCLLAALLLWGAAAPGVRAQGDADKALAEIQKLGGKVERDEAAPDKPIVGINFGVTQVADAGLENVKGFARLKKLTLNNTKITDAGLENLKGLTELRKLYLVDTQIGDAGLEKLKGLANLQVLSLVGTQVTDAGLEHLKGLGNLQELFIAGTKVGDDALKKFKEAMPKVKVDR